MYRLKLLLFAFLTSAALLAAPVAFAQTQPITGDQAFGGDTGLTAEELAEEAGLGTSDPRLIIGRIINITLGFLGIIAVGLIVYAGFLWMTSQGNPDQIDRAKKILIGATIGLIIILSAFAIAAFVLRVLGSATGLGGNAPNPVNQPDPTPEEPDLFDITATYPEDNADNVIRNVVITYQFTYPVDQASVTGETLKLQYRDGEGNLQPLASEVQPSGTVVEVVPTGTCEDLGDEFASIRCLPADTEIVVQATDGILSAGGQALGCNLSSASYPCRLTFRTGTDIDVAAPEITRFNVGDGEACSETPNIVEVAARDDYGIRRVQFWANDALQLDEVAGTREWRRAFAWDGTGFAAGETVALRIAVTDADSHTVERTETVTMSDAADCDNQSHAGPVIAALSPDNGAPGNLVTITGWGFGTAAGEVYFRCRDADASSGCVTQDDGIWIRARLANEVNPQCTANWSMNTIVVAVPPRQVETDENNEVTETSGAADGPIKIVRSDARSGESRQVFTVNAIVRPGLCAVGSGNTAQVGAAVTAHGVNFREGGQPEQFRFGNPANESNWGALQGAGFNWSPQRIDGLQVPVMQAGATTAYVTAGGQTSNLLPVTVTAGTNVPVIHDVQPPAGHPGDYVIISGANFGTSRGTVKFGTVDAAIDFPAACGTDFWNPTSIRVKVPAGISAGSYAVNVTTADDAVAKRDNAFRVGDYCRGSYEACGNDSSPMQPACLDTSADCIKSAGPGLCKLVPDNGPAGTKLTAIGERFGLFTEGKSAVTFQGGAAAAVTTADWSPTEVQTTVPATAKSGAVTVSDSNGVQSNPLNFEVGSCLASGQAGENNPKCNALGGGVCCGVTTQFPGACAATQADCGQKAGATYSQYYVEFSTAATSTPDAPKPPRVIESCDRQIGVCTEKNFPSPSPWTPRWDNDRSEAKACVNSIITARFTEPIDAATLTTNTIALERCATGSVSEGRASVTDCADAQLLGSGHRITLSGDTNLSITPSGSFAANTWYRVTLRRAITSVAGAAMEADYSWAFQTRESAQPCNVGCVEVTPDPFTATQRGPVDTLPDQPARGGFMATPDADDNACIMINGADKSWNWSATYEGASAIPAYVTVTPRSQNDIADVIANQETAANQPVHLTATEALSNKSDYSRLSIEFAPMTVVQHWPACFSACTNAEVGIEFSRRLAINGVGPAGTFELWQCANDDANCASGTRVGGAAQFKPGSAGRKVYFSGIALQPFKYYRAIVKNVTAIDGKPLSGLNFNDANWAASEGMNSYSWVFKTKAGECQIETVGVDPATPACVGLIGAQQDYGAEPRSASDECSEDGQILNAERYEWNWAVSSGAVGGFTPDLAAQHSRVDQAETVEAIGSGDVSNARQSTEVTARENTTNVNGTGNFCIQCGFTQDSQCLYADGNPANANYGVGTNTCCYPRPQVAPKQPADHAGNVCRNALIEVEFTREMDAASFAGNVVVAANYGTVSCPDGTQYLELALAEQKDATWWQRALRPVKNLAWQVGQWTPVRWTRTQLAKVPVIGTAFTVETGLAGDFSGRWCALEGRVAGYNRNGKGMLTFAPTRLLPTDQDGVQHLVLIAGDNDITDGVKRGVRSREGVTLRGEDIGAAANEQFCDTAGNCTVNNQSFYGSIIDFTTLPRTAENEGVCVMDRVEIDPASWLFRSNVDDARDNAPTDMTNFDTVDTDSDKAFLAVPKAANGQTLVPVGEYRWDWEWAPDGGTNNQLITTAEISPDKTKEGWELVRAKESATIGKTFVEATANITSTIAGVPSGEKSAQAPINVFLCRNPWPVFVAGQPWPFQDDFYNFETYYCRDQGSPQFGDDLPALEGVRLENRDPGVQREYLFTQRDRLRAPENVIVSSHSLGDVSLNGRLDVFDALMIRQHVQGLRTLPPTALGLADTDMDGSLTDNDSTLISQYIVGLEVPLLTTEPGNKLIVMWTPVANAQAYTIYARKASEPYGQPVKERVTCNDANIGIGGKLVNGHCAAVVSDLENNVEYTFVVTGVVTTGTSDGPGGLSYEEGRWSQEASGTPRRSSAVTAPTNLAVTYEGNAMVLTWEHDGVDVERYDVYYGTSYNDAEQNRRQGTAAKRFEVSGLENGAMYYFKVKAVPTSGPESSFSKTAKVLAGGAPVGQWRLVKDEELTYTSSGSGSIWTEEGLFNFKGGTTHVRIAANDRLNLEHTGGFTQQVWIRPSGLSEAKYYGVLTYQNAGVADRYPSIMIDRLTEPRNTNKLHVGFGTGSHTGRTNRWCQVTTPEGVVTDNEWQQLAVVYTTKEYVLYKNGSVVYRAVPRHGEGGSAIACADEAIVPIAQFNLGNGITPDTNYNSNLQGTMTNVAIYNYVRTPEQIQADYNRQRAQFGL